MERRLWVEFSIVAAMATLLLAARVVPQRSEALAAPVSPRQPIRIVLPGFGPDTSGPNWKPLSRDVGLELRDDAFYGRRARLFVRVDGRWESVGIDSPSDIAQFVPAR